MAVSSEADPSPALTEYFADLDDPRRENSTDYPLHEIIVLTICVLTICGVICGADESGSIANFGEAKNWGGKELGRQRIGEAKREWLGQFLELENGIPSHDTIGRFTIGRFTIGRFAIGQFFGLLNPEAFEAQF